MLYISLHTIKILSNPVNLLPTALNGYPRPNRHVVAYKTKKLVARSINRSSAGSDAKKVNQTRTPRIGRNASNILPNSILRGRASKTSRIIHISLVQPVQIGVLNMFLSRETMIAILVRIHQQTISKLFQIVGADNLPGLAPSLGKRGKQQTGQNADDGNHYQLDQLM